MQCVYSFICVSSGIYYTQKQNQTRSINIFKWGNATAHPCTVKQDCPISALNPFPQINLS